VERQQLGTRDPEVLRCLADPERPSHASQDMEAGGISGSLRESYLYSMGAGNPPSALTGRARQQEQFKTCSGALRAGGLSRA
jgi:hypothetical protein